jgi:hypothetical protein
MAYLPLTWHLKVPVESVGSVVGVRDDSSSQSLADSQSFAYSFVSLVGCVLEAEMPMSYDRQLCD